MPLEIDINSVNVGIIVYCAVWHTTTFSDFGVFILNVFMWKQNFNETNKLFIPAHETLLRPHIYVRCLFGVFII